MPKAFSEQEKQAILLELLHQGKKQFSSFGLKKTNIEDIARAAGISKGAFYLFFESKEDLFLQVMERVETEFREQILRMIEASSGTSKQRLTYLLVELFSLWKTIPLLHFFTSSDYQILLRRMPPEVIQRHVQEDTEFMVNLLAQLELSGIPIRVKPEIFMQLMYAMFLVSLHGDDFGPGGLEPGKKILLELIAAYVLGEVPLEVIDLNQWQKIEEE